MNKPRSPIGERGLFVTLLYCFISYSERGKTITLIPSMNMTYVDLASRLFSVRRKLFVFSSIHDLLILG